MEVARHGFDPRVGDADQRTAEIGIGESNSLEHGASAGAVAPFGDSTADVLEIHNQRLQETRCSCETGILKQKMGARRRGRLPRCMTLPKGFYACDLLELDSRREPLLATLRSTRLSEDEPKPTALHEPRRN